MTKTEKRVEGPEPTGQSDIPSDILTFVDPQEQDARHRVVLWAAPGEGKSVGAASAPDPILVVSADRPGAYRFARRHHKGKTIREVRYESDETLKDVYRYLGSDGQDVRTVVIDPFQHVYDQLVDAGPRRSDGDPDYQKINKKIVGFLYALRDFDVNVVLVAHEKLNDGKRGDGKLYPQLGGPSLLNKILAESDIVAHVERVKPDQGPPRYEAQLEPNGNLVCKESTGLLGERRALDLSEWFAAVTPEEEPVPFDTEEPAEPVQEALT